MSNLPDDFGKKGEKSWAGWATIPQGGFLADFPKGWTATFQMASSTPGHGAKCCGEYR
jgi:hypothetical protein